MADHWSDQLRRARKAAGDTQGDVVRKLGVSVNTLRTWEQGLIQRPSRENEKAVEKYVQRHLGEQIEWEAEHE